MSDLIVIGFLIVILRIFNVNIILLTIGGISGYSISSVFGDINN